jgi:hypothetical protein
VTDDRINRYLADRAAHLELAPPSLETVVGRATRRRRTRRGAVAAFVALTVGASAALVTQRGTGEPAADVATEPVVVQVAPSALDWSVVEARSGMSQFHVGTASTDDGAVYTLSTAPGAVDQDALLAPRTLYRSADGRDWSPVALPGDFWPASLASAGGQLYAVGTSPEGGGVTYQVARSDDGGGTWSTDEIPTPYRDLKDRYAGEVSVAPPVIAVHDGTVVVGTSVAGWPNYDDRVPGGLPQDGLVRAVTDEGIVVGHVCDVITAMDGSWSAPTTTAPAPATTAPPGADSADPAVEAARELATTELEASGIAPQGTEPCEPDPDAERTYSWAELGVDDELRDLTLHGRASVYVSRDGGDFTRVDVGDASTMGGQVIATEDGFVGFASRAPRPETPPATMDDLPGYVTEVLRSPDGLTWESAGELQGGVSSAGIVDGRPGVALSGNDGSLTIRLEQADGSWLPVDPAEATSIEDAFVGPVSFGPLGWAATIGAVEGGQTQVVHSVDGTTISAVPLDGLVPPDVFGPVDTSVTADAVVVRVSEPDDGDPATIPRQRVVVGTPAG